MLFPSFFLLSFLLALLSFVNLLGVNHIFLGQAWAEGVGVLATSRHCAHSGQETDCT